MFISNFSQSSPVRRPYNCVRRSENLKNIPSASDLHSSATVDCNMLLSGTLDCVMSDHSVVSLKAGDMIVLNGAEHAWQNNSAEEAVMLFFMTGAKRD